MRNFSVKTLSRWALVASVTTAAATAYASDALKITLSGGSVGGAWSTLKAAPELVTWRIDGGAWTTAVYFRRVIPRPDGYDGVYAYHTHQNRPHRRGNYLIYLAHAWDAGSVAAGVHSLEVTACDIRGNCSSSTTSFSTKQVAS